MIIRDIFLLERSEEFQLSYREEVTVDLSLKKAPVIPETLIIGKVVDDKYNVIKDVTVKIFTLNYKPIEHTKADSCGRFSFNNVIFPGMYYIIATAPGYNVSKGYKIEVKKSHLSKLIIELHKEENCNLGVVYGVVKNRAGKGIDNVAINIFRDKNSENVAAVTYSNNDGEYIVYGLKAGKYFIIANKIGYNLPSKISLIIEANEVTNLDLILYESTFSGSGTISGQILCKEEKVPYALVALYSLDKNNNSHLIKIKQCNEDGVYLFGDIEPGKYMVRCKKIERIVECKEE